MTSQTSDVTNDANLAGVFVVAKFAFVKYTPVFLHHERCSQLAMFLQDTLKLHICREVTGNAVTARRHSLLHKFVNVELQLYH